MAYPYKVPVLAGGVAECYRAGPTADVWVIKTFEGWGATCIPCSSNPVEKFPIEGGYWDCKFNKKVRNSELFKGFL